MSYKSLFFRINELNLLSRYLDLNLKIELKFIQYYQTLTEYWFSIEKLFSKLFLKQISTMPKNKFLNDFEKGQIDAYHKSGQSNCAIGRLLNRSETVVRSYL